LFAHVLASAARPVSLIPTPCSGHGFIYNSEDAWTQRLWPLITAWIEYWLRMDE